MAAVPTSAQQAVQQMRDNTYDPYALSLYLRMNLFRTIVDSSVKTAGVRPYFAGLHNPGSGDIVSFQNTQPYGVPRANIRVWFVPRVSVDLLVGNRNKFPASTLATIDLARSEAPFICTERLTGCCFVIGWDKTNRRMYLGHIEPSGTRDPSGRIRDRHFVADYVRREEVFPVQKSQLSKQIYLGGHDDTLPSSYNNNTVNIIGCITSNRIYMTFQVLHPESGQQVREGMMIAFD